MLISSRNFCSQVPLEKVTRRTRRVLLNFPIPFLKFIIFWGRGEAASVVSSRADWFVCCLVLRLFAWASLLLPPLPAFALWPNLDDVKLVDLAKFQLGS